MASTKVVKKNGILIQNKYSCLGIETDNEQKKKCIPGESAEKVRNGISYIIPWASDFFFSVSNFQQ
jgi:hypothetical protein